MVEGIEVILARRVMAKVGNFVSMCPDVGSWCLTIYCNELQTPSEIFIKYDKGFCDRNWIILRLYSRGHSEKQPPLISKIIMYH